MAIKRKAGGRIRGLAADTKPTAAAEPVDTIFEETDTGKDYSNTGAAWVGRTPSKYAGHTTVYKIGSTYYADKYDGSLLSASGTFETVLQAALDLGGTVYIDSPQTFTFNTIGVTIPTYTRLLMGRATVISPPASSSGFTCFTIGTDPGGNRHSEIFGGRLYKSNNDKNWTGIHFKAVSAAEGQSWCRVEDTSFFKPGTAIKFDINGTGGWMSNFALKHVTIYYPIIGCDFPSVDTANGFKRALFQHVNIQDDNTLHDMTYGFKDVRWRDLTFDHCNVWDLAVPATQKTMLIAPDASNIRIRGGIITRTDNLYFTNNSNSRSVYIESDEWNSPQYGGVKMQTDGLYVANGRRIGGYFPAGGWGITPTWTAYATAPADTETPFLSTNLTVGRRFTTTAALDAGAGLRCPTLIACREWGPVFKMKYRLPVPTANRRIFFGWTSSPALDLNGDDPLNGISGIGLFSRAADTNFQIAHNDGTGATNFFNTGIAINTSIRTFELFAVENETTNKWKYSLYTTTPTVQSTITATDVPAATTGLAPRFQIQTSDALAKIVDCFGLYLETQ